MANDEKENPDELILQTFYELVTGQATEDDLVAAVELALAENDWTGYELKRKLNEHLLACENCRRRTIRGAQLDVMIQTILPGAQIVDVTELFRGRARCTPPTAPGVH